MVPLLAVGLGGVALYLGVRAVRGAAAEANSKREDIAEETDVDYDDDAVSDAAAESYGWPYSFGMGGASTPWSDGARGVDCSGYALMMLVRLGILPADSPRRRATADSGNVLSLANICDPVAVGDQRPGDLAIYPGHVMMVTGDPDPDQGGHSMVQGASGGDSDTHGDDPSAYVKAFRTAQYRGDFLTYGRVKPAYRA